MKHVSLYACLASLLISPAHGTEKEKAPTDPVSLAKLEQSPGQMIWRAHDAAKTDVHWGEVDGIIDRPLADVVHVITQYSQYKKIFPFFTKSTVTESDGVKARMKVRAKIAGGSVVLKGQLRAQLAPLMDDKQVLNIKLEKGNLKRLDARWTAWSIRAGTATVLRLKLLVDPDIWWVRDATLTDYNLVNARRAIRGIRTMLGQDSKKGVPDPAAPQGTNDPSDTAFTGTSPSPGGAASTDFNGAAKATGGASGSNEPK